MMRRESSQIKPRRLPKLFACMKKASLDSFKNKVLYDLKVLDAKGVRRVQKPMHECYILELFEAGYRMSSQLLHDIVYDNQQLLKQDELGIVVDLSARYDYLEYICVGLRNTEKAHGINDVKHESQCMLNLAEYFSEREKGILWLAEKFYHFATAIASRLLSDGGRQKARCKYFYAMFLLDKFPGVDDDEAFEILSEIREIVLGKPWLLHDDDKGPKGSFFTEVVIQLHRVLLNKSRKFRHTDTSKAERLARLAEKRARDANDDLRRAEAILDIGLCQMTMNDLNNSHKNIERALKLYEKIQNINGICESKMHLAAVLARMGGFEVAENLLTDMGILAMLHGLNKHLGYAFQLLGELHLKNQNPVLGTPHLFEAFQCFMGLNLNMASDLLHHNRKGSQTNIITKYEPAKREIFLEEAEQSRFMTAVSGGQELMQSYFDKLHDANTCQIATLKVIEWKLNKVGWWKNQKHHDYHPCLCPKHNRSVIDVLRMKLLKKQAKAEEAGEDDVSCTYMELKKSCSAFILTFEE